MDTAIQRARTGGIEINLGDLEHLAALAAGTSFMVKGIKHGGRGGLALAAIGGLFLYRGQKGYRRLYDLLGVRLPMEPSGIGRYNVRVQADIDIDRSATELYRIWRNLENLPIFMKHLVSVMELDDTYSRWIARGPLGTIIKWDAKVINDVEDELIAWTSLEGSGIDHAGSVRFIPIDKGRTKLTVVMRYDPPAERLGTLISRLFHADPQAEIESDLMYFKQVIEHANLDAPEDKLECCEPNDVLL